MKTNHTPKNIYKLNQEFTTGEVINREYVMSTFKVLWISKASIKFMYKDELIIRRIQRDFDGTEYIYL